MKNHPGLDKQAKKGSIPFAVVLLGSVGIALAMLYVCAEAPMSNRTAKHSAFLPAILIAAECICKLAAVALAAGGLGGLFMRYILPQKLNALFKAVCSIAIGLWILSTLMLAIGSAGFIPNRPVSWLIIAGGAGLAIWQIRGEIHRIKISKMVSKINLSWFIPAGCIGLWLGGAMRPPGFIGSAYSFEVLAYHLQLPREFYNAGMISTLKHNVYSFNPLGVEMLYLWAHCLEGGAYEGVYLAKMMHGLFGLLAVLGIYSGLRYFGRFCSWAGAALLASVPGLLFLSWIAINDLAMICYLTLAIIILIIWLAKNSRREAIAIGLFCGCACSTQYSAILIVALPILVTMLIYGLRLLRRSRVLPQFAIAVIICIAAISPWLIRNFTATGNPIFPHQTQSLGLGHWNTESQQRWANTQSSEELPPVPQPKGYVNTKNYSHDSLIWKNLFASELMGIGIIVLAIAGRIMFYFSNKFRSTIISSITCVLILQILIWIFFSPNLSARFIQPACVPLVMLAAFTIISITQISVKYAKTVATIVFAGALLFNIASAFGIWLMETKFTPAVPPCSPQVIANDFPPFNIAAQLDPDAKVLLIGETRSYYFPPDTVYATAFDTNPLDVSPSEIPQKIKELGITHVLVNWHELWRLAGTVGYPKRFTQGLYAQQLAGKTPPTLPILDTLTTNGAAIKYYGNPSKFPAPVKQRAIWNPNRPPQNWPAISLYTLYNDHKTEIPGK